MHLNVGANQVYVPNQGQQLILTQFQEFVSVLNNLSKEEVPQSHAETLWLSKSDILISKTFHSQPISGGQGVSDV